MSVSSKSLVVTIFNDSMLSSISKVTLETAAAIGSIPTHPESFSVVLTDFLGEVRTIPIELCVDTQVVLYSPPYYMKN